MTIASLYNGYVSSVNKIKLKYELVEDDLRFAANIVLSSASLYFMFYNFDDFCALKATGLTILGSVSIPATIKELRNRSHCIPPQNIETMMKLKPASHDDRREVIVIFKTTDDHNGAFKIPVNNIDQLHDHFRVGFFSVDKKITEITKIMQLIKKNKINVDHLIWMGHGDEDGESVELTEEIDLEKSFVRRKNFPGLSDKAHIHFVSCQTGKEGGIAQAFSKAFPESSVYAPMNDSASRRTWLYFDSKMKPAVMQYGKKGEVITRLYKNGVAVPFPTKDDQRCLAASRKNFALTWLHDVFDQDSKP